MLEKMFCILRRLLSLFFFHYFIQRGPTTFDFRATSQKSDSSRAASNKMIIKISDSQDLITKNS